MCGQGPGVASRAIATFHLCISRLNLLTFLILKFHDSSKRKVERSFGNYLEEEARRRRSQAAPEGPQGGGGGGSGVGGVDGPVPAGLSEGEALAWRAALLARKLEGLGLAGFDLAEARGLGLVGFGPGSGQKARGPGPRSPHLPRAASALLRVQQDQSCCTAPAHFITRHSSHSLAIGPRLHQNSAAARERESHRQIPRAAALRAGRPGALSVVPSRMPR